ncbi:MAG: type II toxin-antitoxin system RelE/ParE family toxin [Candidatus Kapabacteria bacterium]|nr:type II toxin-antitoxin system RelE/ParE family toxin [Candidatus Kapabacteria bacterium]
MREFEIIVSEDAERDLDLIFAWYELQGADLGLKFINSIRNKIKIILDFPNSFPIFYKHIHRAILKDFPYGIYYFLMNQ